MKDVPPECWLVCTSDDRRGDTGPWTCSASLVRRTRNVRQSERRSGRVRTERQATDMSSLPG